jgi:hypothetical protein
MGVRGEGFHWPSPERPGCAHSPTSLLVFSQSFLGHAAALLVFRWCGTSNRRDGHVPLEIKSRPNVWPRCSTVGSTVDWMIREGDRELV